MVIAPDLHQSSHSSLKARAATGERLQLGPSEEPKLDFWPVLVPSTTYEMRSPTPAPRRSLNSKPGFPRKNWLTRIGAASFQRMRLLVNMIRK